MIHVRPVRRFIWPFLAVLMLISAASLVAAGDEDDIDSLWGEPEDDDGAGWYQQPVLVVSMGYFITPAAGTVWEHGETGVRIEWQGFEGDTVKIELLREGEKLADLTPWHTSEGFFVRAAPVVESWGSGRHFRIAVTDRTGNSITSDEFLILAPFSVITPDAGTKWAHGSGDQLVSWTTCDGSQVMIELCSTDDFSVIAPLSGWIPNEGSYAIPEVSSLWGTGNAYMVRITDDLGNFTRGDPFSIQSVRIDSPSADLPWEIGQIPSDIRWYCAGTIVSIELWEEGGAGPVDLLADWVPNSGEFTFGEAFDHSLLEPGKRYFVRIINDLEQAGDSDAFDVIYSDNLPQGAVQLYDSSSGSIDPPGDNDIWMVRVSGKRMGRIVLSSDELLLMTVYLVDTGQLITSGSSSEVVEWYTDRREDYFVDVSAESPDVTADYLVSFSDFVPPERNRSFRVAVSGEGGLGDYRDIMTEGARLSFSWFPRPFLELGLEFSWVSVDPAIYTAFPCSSMAYLGPFISLHRPILGRLGGFGGLLYLGRITDCEGIYGSDYENYEESLNGGFSPFAGIDYMVLSSRRGMALFAALRYIYIVKTSGVMNLCLQVAF